MNRLKTSNKEKELKKYSTRKCSLGFVGQRVDSFGFVLKIDIG
mgnify:CR=1 FL=1